jgi:ARP2/3 complex 16 kDa subunit (p16-Arc)
LKKRKIEKMSDDEDEKPKRVMKTTEIKINDSMDVIQKRAKDVDALLAKSNAKDAVITAIADPPLGSKNEQAKEVCYTHASCAQ